VRYVHYSKSLGKSLRSNYTLIIASSRVSRDCEIFARGAKLEMAIWHADRTAPVVLCTDSIKKLPADRINLVPELRILASVWAQIARKEIFRWVFIPWWSLSL
jgi:hypothetical protein